MDSREQIPGLLPLPMREGVMMMARGERDVDRIERGTCE